MATTLPDTSLVLTGDRFFTNVDCFLRLSELAVPLEVPLVGLVLNTEETSAEWGRDFERERGLELELKSTTHEELGVDCS